jgi:hypothetical protein
VFIKPVKVFNPENKKAIGSVDSGYQAVPGMR